MRTPPNPHATDPNCYSSHMFAAEATRLIDSHAAAAAARRAGAPKPFFLYLALQVTATRPPPTARSRSLRSALREQIIASTQPMPVPRHTLLLPGGSTGRARAGRGPDGVC